MNIRIFFLIVAILMSSTALSSTSYGTLSNFDVVNDTERECQGFEIEIEDLHSSDITHTYNHNHYGTPVITEDNTDPAHPKVIILYLGEKDAAGRYLEFTVVPTEPISPTDGHQCTNTAVNIGCEHFGVGYRVQPTSSHYRWLCDDGSGTLVPSAWSNITMPVFNYSPPDGQRGAVVRAVLPPPEPPEVHVAEFGEAVWVKSIVTVTHNNNAIALEDLVADDPNDPNDDNWRNGEPAEIEIEWQILQEEFDHADDLADNIVGREEELEDGDETITRRYEFYEYNGPYDDETHEALCDKYPDPKPKKPECDVELLGNYIGAQMAGFLVEVPLGLIDNLQDAVEDDDYPDRAVVFGGNTPYQITITDGVLPEGMSINLTTGVLSGAPSESGTFEFTLSVADADQTAATQDYAMLVRKANGERILADGFEGP